MNVTQVDLYRHSHAYLVKALGQWLTSMGLNAASAGPIVELHLRESAYVMPVQVEVASQRRLLGQRELPLDLSEQLQTLVTFESVVDFVGVFRVFARTLLNRSGVADLLRGTAPERGQIRGHVNPRVSGVLSALGTVQSLREACEYVPLLELLERVATERRGLDGARGFDDKDIKALQLLKHAGAASLSKKVTEIGKDVGSIGWARWVRGLHTGLNYFQRTYDFDNALFWRAVYNAEAQAAGPWTLAKEISANVQEMGLPLALSFFGDIGRSKFAKPDKHVTDALAAFYGHNVSAKSAFEMLQVHAQVAGVSPRCLDKVFYLAGSGNFYLTEFELRQKLKPRFLEMLNALREGQPPPPQGNSI